MYYLVDSAGKLRILCKFTFFFCFYGQYFRDIHTRREILQIITPCLNKDTGCDWIGEVRSAEVRVKRLLLIPCSCK